MNAIKMSESSSAVADGAAASVTAVSAVAAEVQGTLDVKSLLAALRAATEEECCEILTALHKGMPLYAERTDGAAAASAPAPTAKKARGRPKKAAPVAAAAAAALPSAEDGDAPTADAYRVPAEDIDESVCVGRRVAEMDKRWKPAVFREAQCGKAALEGSDLCAVCSRRQEKFADEEDATKAAKIGWLNRLTEEPPEWCHMLGTEWAEEKKPKWLGAGASGSASASASEAGSVDGDGEEAPAAAAAAAAAPAPKKAAAAKPSAEEKAAAKAEKAAAAAAEKAAAKAAKEAEKAAAKAAKEAEKAAEKAEKEAKKAAEKEAAAAAKKASAKPAAKKAATAPAKAAPAVAAKADTAAAAEDSEGELTMIGGDLYMVRKGKVFAYDQISEETGECVGLLGEDGESILPLSSAGAGAAESDAEDEDEDEDDEEVLAD
jgi:hypothetical protein